MGCRYFVTCPKGKTFWADEIFDFGDFVVAKIYKPLETVSVTMKKDGTRWSKICSVDKLPTLRLNSSDLKFYENAISKYLGGD